MSKGAKYILTFGSGEFVHFIRHLPDISDAEIDEMRNLNPVSPSRLVEDDLE